MCESFVKEWSGDKVLNEYETAEMKIAAFA
jgi:hypothetical protein